VIHTAVQKLVGRGKVGRVGREEPAVLRCIGSSLLSVAVRKRQRPI